MMKSRIVSVALSLALVIGLSGGVCQAKNYVSTMPDSTIKHHEEKTFDELQGWMKSQNAKDEGFEELVKYWDNPKSLLIPAFEEGALKKVYVDSNVNFISFNFETPAINIAIKKVETDKAFTDVYSYMETQYGVKYGEKVPIISTVPMVSTGYEYSEHIYTKESIAMQDKTRDCVLETSYSQKSSTKYLITFIEDEIQVSMTYYGKQGEAFDTSIFKKLSFTNPLRNTTDTEKPTEDDKSVSVVKEIQYDGTINVKTKGTSVFKKAKKNKKTIIIPKVYEKNGVSYKVTEIAAKACSKNQTVKTVTIGVNVKKIGKDAFKDCKKLKKIVILSTQINAIGKNAFKGIAKNAKIYVDSKKYKKYKRLLKKAGIKSTNLYKSK